jgi:hypothetical protein
MMRLEGDYMVRRGPTDDPHYADNLILNLCCRTNNASIDLPLAVFVGNRERVEKLLVDD